MGKEQETVYHDGTCSRKGIGGSSSVGASVDVSFCDGARRTREKEQ